MTALPEQLERDEARQRLAVVGSSTTSVGRVRGLVAGRQDHRRIFRYAATSLIALAVSEVCLVALDAETAMGATLAALLANFAGTAPSYLLSRYWIWSEADRRRPARQVVLYWTTSLVSMGISSLVTGAIADADHAHRILKLLVLGAVYLLVSLALWVAKYVAYQTVIFRSAPARSVPVESID